MECATNHINRWLALPLLDCIGMNLSKLGLGRRSGYSRRLNARHRRNAKLSGGLACLLLLWLAFGANERLVSIRSAILPDLPDAEVEPSAVPAATTDSVTRAASSKPANAGSPLSTERRAASRPRSPVSAR